MSREEELEIKIDELEDRVEELERELEDLQEEYDSIESDNGYNDRIIAKIPDKICNLFVENNIDLGTAIILEEKISEILKERGYKYYV